MKLIHQKQNEKDEKEREKITDRKCNRNMYRTYKIECVPESIHIAARKLIEKSTCIELLLQLPWLQQQHRSHAQSFFHWWKFLAGEESHSCVYQSSICTMYIYLQTIFNAHTHTHNDEFKYIVCNTFNCIIFSVCFVAFILFMSILLYLCILRTQFFISVPFICDGE